MIYAVQRSLESITLYILPISVIHRFLHAAGKYRQYNAEKQRPPEAIYFNTIHNAGSNQNNEGVDDKQKYAQRNNGNGQGK